MNIVDSLRKIVYNKKDLESGEAELIANAIMKNEIPEIQTAGLLVALSMKGESPEEIVGFARAMRANALRIDFPDSLDTAGTGGDAFNTTNESTASALILSQIFPVAKHGNRAVSSKSGSADVLEALGYNISVSQEKAIELIKSTNFVFLFAQLYHPAMKNVANVRRTLGIRTIFNILGPLTNPAGTKYQMIGVFSKDFLQKLAEASIKLGYERVFLYHGEPGIDEVSPSGYTYIYEVYSNKTESYKVHYSEFGLKEPTSLDKLVVSTAEDSAIRILRGILGLEKSVRDFIAINVSVGLKLLGKVKDYKDGYEYAIQLISSSLPHIRRIIESNGDVKKFDMLVGRAGKG
jgi:anthranilate phosphoribosyltransferase